MVITVSAPGKVHLLGEHAVVYGYPALLSSVDRRIYVSVKDLSKKDDSRFPEGLRINSFGKRDVIENTVSVFRKSYRIDKFPHLEVDISSRIPVGSGMGSSAALSAALIGVLMKRVKNIWNPIRINELAYEAEKKTHGNPSGADNTTVVFGGLVWFRREFEFLRSIWSLPVKDYIMPKLLLIDSGCPLESTREMVDHVASLYNKRKKYISEIFHHQEFLTRKILLSLRRGDNNEFLSALILGQKNLEKMEVVGKKAVDIISKIEKNGGGAKISGAGGKKEGSGIILCYHKNLSVIKNLATKEKWDVSNILLGTEGIRIEHKESAKKIT
jgi:mevalonate kinase